MTILNRFENNQYREYKLLDVGCGEGHVFKSIKLPHFEIYGTDISERALEKAKLAYNEVCQMDVNSKLLYDNEKFDVIICFSLIEHLFNPEQILLELLRVGKKEGIIILGVPNGLNIFNRLSILFGDFIDWCDVAHNDKNALFSEHIRFFSKNVFFKLIELNGGIVNEFFVYFPKKPNKKNKLEFLIIKIINILKLHKLWPSLFAMSFIAVVSRKR